MHASKGLASILWVIIAAVVLGGGYLVVQKAKWKMRNQLQSKQSLSAERKETEPQAVVPADWKTYRNEEYRFEFSYRARIFHWI